MKLVSSVCLNSHNNRYKVIINKNDNDNDDTFLNTIKSKINQYNNNLVNDLILKSSYNTHSQKIYIVETINKIHSSSYGLRCLSENMFRDNTTDYFWKKLKTKDGKVVYLRDKNENLGQLLQEFSQLTAYASVNRKSLKDGDIIVFVAKRGNLELGLIINDNYIFNISQNKIMHLNNICNDELVNCITNEEIKDNEINDKEKYNELQNN